MSANKTEESSAPPVMYSEVAPPILLPQESRQNGNHPTNSPTAIPIATDCPLEILQEEITSRDGSRQQVYRKDNDFWEWMRPLKFLTRSNTIWMTNGRIIIREQVGVFGIPSMDTVQSFQLSDLKNVSIKLDYRLKELVIFFLFLFFDVEFLMSDSHILHVIGALLTIVTFFIFVHYIIRLSLKKELMLDFYKTDTVNTWLDFRNSITASRYGSSITKALCFKEKDIKEIAGKIYERHPNLVTYSGQDEGALYESIEAHGTRSEADQSFASGESSSGLRHRFRPLYVSKYSPFMGRPHPTWHQFQLDPALLNIVQSGYPQTTMTPITVENELFIENEECYAHEEGRHNPFSATTDDCGGPLGLFLRERSTLFVMRHRIIIKMDTLLCGFEVLSRKEFFKISDLQNKTITRKSSLWFLLMAIPTSVVGIVVAVMAHVVAGILIIFIGLLIVLIFSFALRKTTLVLDFYRNDTVHSWLPSFDSVVSWRYGSSISRSLRFDYEKCKRVVNVLHKLDMVRRLEIVKASINQK